jgi:ribonuclease BN (tRNA processing enzyme)
LRVQLKVVGVERRAHFQSRERQSPGAFARHWHVPRKSGVLVTHNHSDHYNGMGDFVNTICFRPAPRLRRPLSVVSKSKHQYSWFASLESDAQRIAYNLVEAWTGTLMEVGDFFRNVQRPNRFNGYVCAHVRVRSDDTSLRSLSHKHCLVLVILWLGKGMLILAHSSGALVNHYATPSPISIPCLAT